MNQKLAGYIIIHSYPIFYAIKLWEELLMAKGKYEGKLLKVASVSLVVGALLYPAVTIVFGRDSGSFFVTLFPDGLRDQMINLYIAQLSLTFITITVTGSLSDNSNIIYWENIAEKKLIAPTWTCFLAYTSYSFVTIIYSTIAIFVDRFNAPAFFLFFFLDVLFLRLLTLNMVDVYYNREEKKEKLKAAFIACSKEVARRKEDGTLAGSDCGRQFLDMTLGMRQQTMKAYDTKDYRILSENLMFLAENLEYMQAMDDFSHDMGNIDYIFSCMDENTLFTVNECIRIILRRAPSLKVTFVNKILDGLLDEERIRALTKELNRYNVSRYLNNLRDAALAEALLLRIDSQWLGTELKDSEKKALFDTIGEKEDLFDLSVIDISSDEAAKELSNAYLNNLEPLFKMAQQDEKVNYTLGEMMYNLSYDIPYAADRIYDLMKVKTIQNIWRISNPGDPDNSRYGEVLEFFPGGNGRAYLTIQDYKDGKVYSNLTYDNTTGYICVQYIGKDRSVIFQLDDGFLRGDNDEVIYSLMDI